MSDKIDDQASKSGKDQLTKHIQESLAKEALKIYGSHAPLDNSKREIRLLSLRDSDDANALLIGELRIATLDDDHTALSYVWGDGSNRCPIGLNGFDTTITANLAIALKRLRSEKKALNIWTDAICINQTDKTEKSQQVQMMSDIYRSANMGTIIWLGERENDSDEAMRFVSTANQTVFDNYDPKNPSFIWEALAHLLKRDWWKRMWVIQETMLSPNPVLKCGSEETSFEKFVALRNLHWDAENADLERFRPLRNLWRDCPFAPLMCHNWRTWVGGTLGSWLIDVAAFQCLYPRDKIYALLGLIRQDIRDQVTVEYDSVVKSDRMVFVEATRLCFLELGLLTLQQGQVEKELSLQLPSWCSDWTSKAMFEPFVGFGFSPYPTASSFRPPSNKWLFGGDQDDKPMYAFSKDGEILFVHGFMVDRVDFVEGIGTEEAPEVPFYTGEDEEERAYSREKRLQTTKKACLRWEQQVQNTKTTYHPDPECGYEEAFCRTIIANRDFNKNKLKSDVKPIFDAWVGREIPSDGPSIPDPEKLQRIQDYSNSAVSRCAKRTFITTKNGRFGLAPQTTKVGDLVCIFYTGEVAYILREPLPELEGTPGSFVGEAYIHGIMQGEYLDTAKGEDFTAFWFK